VLKKSFLADERNFSGPLVRFVRGDMWDHIVSHKNDHGRLYRAYRALQRWRRLKIDFCEIFGVVRFSTFATVSAQSGRYNSSASPCTLRIDERRCWLAVSVNPEGSHNHPA
jgi:hypothetical protein